MRVICDGSVAQLVEQSPLKRTVGGFEAPRTHEVASDTDSGFVQRQDCWFWPSQSGFESLTRS
jgi:hypothetical protein